MIKRLSIPELIEIVDSYTGGDPGLTEYERSLLTNLDNNSNSESAAEFIRYMKTGPDNLMILRLCIMRLLRDSTPRCRHAAAMVWNAVEKCSLMGPLAIDISLDGLRLPDGELNPKLLERSIVTRPSIPIMDDPSIPRKQHVKLDALIAQLDSEDIVVRTRAAAALFNKDWLTYRYGIGQAEEQPLASSE